MTEISIKADLVEELKHYLEIDKYKLDDEIIRQPVLFFKVSEAYVEAAAERDALKEKMATVDAEVDYKIRHQYDVAGTKYTETLIRGEVLISRDHEAHYSLYSEAKKQADLLGALKDAFQQRSYMLRDMASLYVANYFDSTSVRGTDSTDTATYKRQRERLSIARENKK